MFTGIIEEIGMIKEIKKEAARFELTIAAKKVLEDAQLGDSIAVNGICLTVISYTTDQFTVDVMPETLKATSLQSLVKGSHVNLERAMAAKGRFGGHFVSGHVDTVGTIQAKHAMVNAVYFWIAISPSFIKYMVPKGSICIDGISLTVVEVKEDSFSISIIPHTIDQTILQHRKVGDIVNVECDVLAKYIDKLIDFRETSAITKESLTLEKLSEHGYI